MANPKKFLDADGLTYFAQLLNNYPDNTILAAVIDAIQDALDTKADSADVPPATTVSQTLTSGIEIGSVNNTKLYAPDNSGLETRIAALEQLEWATYYSGRSNPSNSQGQNGDIYLQY